MGLWTAKGMGAATLAGTLLAAAQPAFADTTTDRISDLERKLERSLQVIEQLTRKVEQLETARTPVAPPPDAPPPAGIEARVSGLEQQVSAIGSRATTDDGLALHGFADVGLRASRPGNRRGAALGSVDLYLAPQFGSNVRSLIELVFETGEDGKIATDLERLQLGYTFSDALTTWLGRFHVPYGYWNTAFHHGAQIQTSILRPRFLDFEDRGGILPAHGVGLWATGKVGAGTGKLNYDAYVVNSPRISLEDPATPGTGVLDPNLAGATNHNALVGGKVGYDFGGRLQGLTLGVHGFAMKVEDDATPVLRSRVRMLGGYGTWLEDNWEVLGEYYRFSDRNLDGAGSSHGSWAGYLQAGYLFGRWTPYARVERAALDQGDNYFAQQASGQSYDRGVIGLRFDIDARSAVKVELNRTHFTDRATAHVNEARFQYAIRF
ncbi:hypothetical protein [Ramlibacter sp. AN1133]|uniref:hypothetical protein n=1 Tax=Ramlibacter sp. AN1133 TaxID=3133429 RepID=UPI0030C14D62